MRRGADLIPKVSVSISGNPIGENALEFVESVSVEQALDKADLITLRVFNPFKETPGKGRTSELLWTDAMAWMPGNLLEVWYSYGDKPPQTVHAGIMKKWMPNFPANGMPRIDIKALDGSTLMMEGPDAMDPRRYSPDVTLSDMVVDVLHNYGYSLRRVRDVPTAPAVPTIKKAGMADYAFVRGIANLLGYDFYVEWDRSEQRWAAVFGPPEVDYSHYKTFAWGPDFETTGANGILLDFQPELAVQGTTTDVEVYYFDRDTKTWEKVNYPPKPPPKTRGGREKPVFRWRGDDHSAALDLRSVGSPESARGLRIKAAGLSVEVVPAHGFRSAEEAYRFARAWWRTRQQLLIQGKGRIVGWPELAPGQVHEFTGLGAGLSGDWYIAETKHTFRRGASFITEFVARKVIP